MCGIAGSFDTSMFEVLMEGNKSRGNFSMGVVQVKDRKGGKQTIKQKGEIDFNKVKLLEKARYYIGHAQAPTSAKRDWGYETSHPFESQDWLVVHNGVLSNDDELKKKEVPWDENPVDTSRIVSLLQKVTKEVGTLTLAEQYEVIQITLKKLKGTFALAIMYLPTNEVYIVRQGSVLHFDKKGNFSTVKGQSHELVPEGVVFRLKGKTWAEVGKFESDSPFLFV